MFTLNCRGKLLLIDKPIVMGIINTTPDSFYAQSRHSQKDAALQQAEKYVNEGATILDIGGQSTRPGAEWLGASEETARVVPVIEALHQHFPDSFISVDTFYSKVAEAAAEAGATIINDVSAGTIDKDMLTTAAGLHMPYVCMHHRGIPAGIEPVTPYEDVMLTLLDFFVQKVAECTAAGINDVIIDPGFGFGKTVEDNFKIVQKLGVLQMLDKPILLGVSRKSTIYKTLGVSAEESLNGTTVLHSIGLSAGANILRVHDVKEAKQVIDLLDSFSKK